MADLAQRIGAWLSEQDRWRAGMRPVYGETDQTHRLTYVWNMEELTRVLSCGVDEAPGWGWPAAGSGWTPDLNDGPTAGALHDIAEEVCGGPVELTWWGDPGWEARRSEDDMQHGLAPMHMGPTRGACLAALILAVGAVDD